MTGVNSVTAMRRSPWGVLLVALALCAAAMVFRYGVVEFRPVASLCDVTTPPFWCAIRELIIGVFYSDAVGIASFVVGLLAILLYTQPGGRTLAILAVLFGAPAIVLYSADFAVPGFLLGFLRLVRG